MVYEWRIGARIGAMELAMAGDARGWRRAWLAMAGDGWRCAWLATAIRCGVGCDFEHAGLQFTRTQLSMARAV